MVYLVRIELVLPNPDPLQEYSDSDLVKIKLLKYGLFKLLCSVADPDPGSSAFLTPGSGNRDEQPEDHIS
jgi:hypothetical protein